MTQKAFPSANKGFARALAGLKAAILGGIVADSETVVALSGFSTTLDASVYESQVRSSGDGLATVLIPVSGMVLGQRKLVSFVTEVSGADGIRIKAAAGGQLVSEGFSITATGYAEGLHTQCDLLSGNDQALYEFRGLSGTTPTWNQIYKTNSAANS